MSSLKINKNEYWGSDNPSTLRAALLYQQRIKELRKAEELASKSKDLKELQEKVDSSWAIEIQRKQQEKLIKKSLANEYQQIYQRKRELALREKERQRMQEQLILEQVKKAEQAESHRKALQKERIEREQREFLSLTELQRQAKKRQALEDQLKDRQRLSTARAIFQQEPSGHIDTFQHFNKNPLLRDCFHPQAQNTSLATEHVPHSTSGYIGSRKGSSASSVAPSTHLRSATPANPFIHRMRRGEGQVHPFRIW